MRRYREFRGRIHARVNMCIVEGCVACHAPADIRYSIREVDGRSIAGAIA